MQKSLEICYPDISKTKILIEPRHILGLLGNQQGTGDQHTTVLVEQYIKECLQVSTPAGAFVLADMLETRSPHQIAVQGITFHSGKIIGRMLRNSESYAFFMVTAGPGPEQLVRILMEKENYLEAYITDLVASALVEAVAGQVQEEVRKLANSRDMKITNRYSPGYCLWELKEQHKLFSLFPEKCCGISLSESSLMIPVKSASGIIGIGTRVKYRDYTCEICTMKNCLFRKSRPVQ
jgi:hypothetical protein